MTCTLVVVISLMFAPALLLAQDAQERLVQAVPRYVHPRAGYSFVPPAGWVLDDAGPGDGVRLRLENGAGLIEIASGKVGIRMDPTSYAAGWESVSVGPGKLLGEKRFGRVSTVAGEKSYEAVYEGPGVLCKVVFVATADRMFVVTGSFGTDEFKVGAGIFDRVIQSLVLTP